MLAFVCSVTDPDAFASCAGASIERLRARESIEEYVLSAVGSVARTYNLALDRIGAGDDLEGVVFIHQDAEIQSADFCERVRRALAQPEVGVVGMVGAQGTRTMAWWEGDATWDTFKLSYPDVPDDWIPQLAWRMGRGEIATPCEVDVLDGFVLVLSPDAVRTLRFDETLDAKHGYDADICRQAKAAGLRVMACDLGVVHHHEPDLVRDPDAWIEAQVLFAQKWREYPGADTREGLELETVWRIEAEAALARVVSASELLSAHASAYAEELDRNRLTHTRSWKLTAPLRKIKRTIGSLRGEPRSSG